MASKIKSTKKNVYAKQDREDNKKFMIVLALATVALMLMLYFLFA